MEKDDVEPGTTPVRWDLLENRDMREALYLPNEPKDADNGATRPENTNT